MQDPYNYPFIQKDNTMYLSTISKCVFKIKLRMILQPELITIDNQRFKKEIFKGHCRRRLFLKNKQGLILHCLHMFNQYQTNINN